MARPAENKADKRRASELLAQGPFHLRLPDVSPERKPRKSARAAAGSERKETGPDPVARAKAQISRKRYDDGQQHVTGMIDRMRDRRRKLFGRLWVVSVVITALSIVALAVELIQDWNFKAAESVSAPRDPAPSRPLARKSSTRPRRPVTPAGGKVWTTELSDVPPGENPVKSALYTTEGSGKPKGVWLDGIISDDESDDSNR
ncbi:MAG: hypothetical protein HY290_03855 [Planctomycetia bacterium]|nr:hypothetical protein [Planctomycetia bacterium]